MIVRKLTKGKFVLMVFSAIMILVLISVNALSQNLTKVFLYPARHNNDMFEINEIRFSGNIHISSDILKKILTSMPSERSLPHQALQYYSDVVGANRAAPPLLKKALANSMKDMLNEIRYFNRSLADDDLSRIKNFYYQNGFHRTQAIYSFEADTNAKANVLTFHITENEQWVLKNMIYLGLDSVDSEVKDKIKEVKTVKVDISFNEFVITTESAKIWRILIDNGYFYAKTEMPRVIIDTTAKTDSVIVKFITGKRQRIGNINFVDSLKGQSIVVNEMKLAQLDFKTGEWFSRKKVDNSYSNLLSLGTFDMVTIDTSSYKYRITDSVLPFRIFTQYRKQEEYGLGLFTNQTAIDKFWNVGIEVSYSHRNFLGAAQTVSPFIRVVLKDVSRFIGNFSKPEIEYQMGFNWSQPLVWTVDQARIGLTAQLLWSYSITIQGLQIRTLSFPVKFPIRLPNWTYFNNLSLDFLFEQQKPLNLADARTSMYANTKTRQDTINVLQTLSIYQNLSNFIAEKSPFLTASLIGMSFVGDDRDNPFTPTSGKFSAFSIDGLNPLLLPWGQSFTNKFAGNAKYYRIQLTNYWFWSMSRNLVFGLKQREGYIYWFDKEKLSYVPFERQFFAGGANSIRGWASRQLRYSKILTSREERNSTSYSFATDFIGNAGLIEGSAEFRYSFSYPTYVGGTIADLISSLGVTGFVDWGNAYQWLILNDKGQYSVEYSVMDIVKGIAVAAGFGIRYNTPVGPFRIDLAWPMYDPNKEFAPLTNMQFLIGLGHAF